LGALLSLPKVLDLALQLDLMLLGLIVKLGPKHFQQVSIVLGPAVVLEGGHSSIVFLIKNCIWKRCFLCQKLLGIVRQLDSTL